jgi:2-polyprenyl-3-methyl-5-hydroxy-6-metoxy-1,4-benzoquinol methylase
MSPPETQIDPAATTAERPKMAERRRFTRQEFDRAYDALVLESAYLEEGRYYHLYRRRYRKTLAYLAGMELPRPARLLEVGGGQIALLASELFNDQCTVADVNENYAEAVKKVHVDFVACDLVHDDLPYRDHFDVIVLCEVVEHLPVPPHLVLRRMARWLRPGGAILITTPNLYRLRNVLRLALGMSLFCPWFYPPRGRPIGHVTEYSASHLRFQLQRGGFKVDQIDLVQLTNAGSYWWSKIARLLLAPLMLVRPLWRDGLVAVATRTEAAPEDAQPETRAGDATQHPGLGGRT